MKLYMNYNTLYNYGKYLNDKSLEFRRLTAQMSATIKSIDAYWDGYDSQIFINNMVTYVKGLKEVEDALASFGEYVRKITLKYDANESKLLQDINRSDI